MIYKKLYPEKAGRFLPLYINKNCLYASRGMSLYLSIDSCQKFKKVASYPTNLIIRLASRINILSRIGRLGFHALQLLPDRAMVAIIKGAIIYKSPDSNKFVKSFLIKRGSRPLNICLAPSGKIYFGEYFGNRQREEVNIYRSLDGQTWDVVYTFPPGSIRHVHGIFSDVIRKGLWVLTGDKDHESGLWFTNDDFGKLSKQIEGNQKARALSIISLNNGLIIPMDTPQEVNYINFFNLETKDFKALQKLPGSAFHSYRDNELMLISTVVEPSEVNKANFASVFASLNGINWKCIAQFKKDFFPLRLKKYFRYPEIILPNGRNDTDYIYAFGRAIKKFDGYLFVWEKVELMKFLKNKE